MADHSVRFRSGVRFSLIGRDPAPKGKRGLLDGLAPAGDRAAATRRKSLPDLRDPDECGPTAGELLWLALLCGPVWLFVAASYWLGGGA